MKGWGTQQDDHPTSGGASAADMAAGKGALERCRVRLDAYRRSSPGQR